MIWVNTVAQAERVAERLRREKAGRYRRAKTLVEVIDGVLIEADRLRRARASAEIEASVADGDVGGRTTDAIAAKGERRID